MGQSPIEIGLEPSKSSGSDGGTAAKSAARSSSTGLSRCVRISSVM